MTSAGSDLGQRGPGPRAGQVFRPRTIPELLGLVRQCRETGTQVAPASSRDACQRSEPDAAIVDMGAFDEVVRCDRRNRVLLFEAGVTFDALAKAAGGVGLRPMLPLCPRPGKSALAAYLDREPTIYPRFQWDMADPLLCVEIVLGTGELFRTGGAAGPGTLEQQWKAGDAQKNPMGPGPADFMRIFQGSRGAFGIVTWCSVKAEPAPRDEVLYAVSSDSPQALIEMTYGLMRRNHPDICFLIDGPGLAALECRDRSAFEEQRSRAPGWSLVFSLSKPRFAGDEKLAYVGREARDLARGLGLGNDLEQFARGREGLHRIVTDPSHPANARWWKLAGCESAESLFLQTTLDRAPALLTLATDLCDHHGVNGRDLLRYVQPQLGGRCCHLELIFPGAGSRIRSELLPDLRRELAAAGGYFSRLHGPWRDIADSGASALPLLRKLKAIFDPDGILAPQASRYFTPPAAVGARVEALDSNEKGADGKGGPGRSS